MLQISSPGLICKLQQCLVALSVQFVKGIVEIILILKLADMLVSLSQNFKCPLPSIPISKSFVTEVRDEKFGISSQSSPQDMPCFSEGTSVVLNPLFQRATTAAPGFLRINTVPLWRQTFVEITSLVHYAIVTATTTNHHHCHQQTKMTIDSNHCIPAIPLIPAVVLLMSSAGSHNPILIPWVTIVPELNL